MSMLSTVTHVPAPCLQPAVSPISNRQRVETRTAGGLETRDTADWKSALRFGASGRSTVASVPSVDVSFHYISASPWQLYEPLATFIESNGFPAGTFELKQFRWKDRSFLSLFANPEKYKPGVIEPLLKQFPNRTFVLVGDSGERDPEIYGALARKYPQQIVRILIRDVTNETAEAARYQKAFREVPVEKWQIFREPDEIKFLRE